MMPSGSTESLVNEGQRIKKNGIVKQGLALGQTASRRGWHVLLGGWGQRFSRALPFFGPAFLVAVGYIDPGNWATDIAAGSQFGYQLLWVILLSNLMAITLQLVAARLGVATGKSLAQNCRQHFSRPVVLLLWITAELAAIATDMAEFLGAAIGLQLLFGLSLWQAGLATAVIVFGILFLGKRGTRRLEPFILFFVGVVGLAYLLETWLVRPDWLAIGQHLIVPQLTLSSAFVAVGIIGATVMPHNLYLHSAAVLSRAEGKRVTERQGLMRYVATDTVVALNAAFLINSAMIVMAAAAFYQRGLAIDSLDRAFQTLTPLLGPAASFAFAIALLAAGLSSSTTGTVAGQVIMEGFLERELPVWLPRLLTVVPALAVLALGWNALTVLVWSQVILSLQLPFTVIPLLLLTGRREVMGPFLQQRVVQWLGWAVTGIILGLNFYLLWTFVA